MNDCIFMLTNARQHPHTNTSFARWTDPSLFELWALAIHSRYPNARFIARNIAGLDEPYAPGQPFPSLLSTRTTRDLKFPASNMWHQWLDTLHHLSGKGINVSLYLGNADGDINWRARAYDSTTLDQYRRQAREIREAGATVILDTAASRLDRYSLGYRAYGDDLIAAIEAMPHPYKEGGESNPEYQRLRHEVCNRHLPTISHMHYLWRRAIRYRHFFNIAPAYSYGFGTAEDTMPRSLVHWGMLDGHAAIALGFPTNETVPKVMAELIRHAREASVVPVVTVPPSDPLSHLVAIEDQLASVPHSTIPVPTPTQVKERMGD